MAKQIPPVGNNTPPGSRANNSKAAAAGSEGVALSGIGMVSVDGEAPLSAPLSGGKAPAAVVMARSPRVRLLPLVIFASVLMLSARLGSLWQDAQSLPESLQVGQNQAFAQQASTSVTPPLPLTSPPAAMLAVQSGPRIQLAQGGEGTPAPSGPTSITSGGACDPLKDPVNLTQTEIDVLQKLAERREVMDKRERELETRENLLKAAEQRIDAKVTDMRTLENTIKDLLKKHDAQELERINQLVKIYAAMKPVEAAAIFNDLEMDILLTIMENMKEAKSASILAAMDPAKARILTAELSKRRKIPLPGQ
ncbi:MotE family protein [Novispirillum itersonii]|uniref:Flagellar motility protein MotE (MotC chaperone) n=1 Tax=Novispirillum itersonii TaxID=189 RepID=A0A7X0DKT3_NOVIT|nr:hypothetical protein [Novispirillum itersonii]MBB6209283.1 flagellar motility protein MotE (MotC chaperone) [Novispirillum itersonii]